jgi:hypothetical protein
MPATDTAACNMRERLMPLEEITDLVTARLDGPLQDHADIHTDEETAAAAWLVAEAVRYLNAATQGPAAPGVTEPSTAYAVAGALAVASARLARLASQLAEWLASEVASGGLKAEVTGGCVHLASAAHAASLLEYAMSAAMDDLAPLRSQVQR